MVKSILKIGVRKYKLKLRKSIQEILSNIYYRMYFYYKTVSKGALIASKIIIQVDTRRDARSFWWWWGGREK